MPRRDQIQITIVIRTHPGATEVQTLLRPHLAEDSPLVADLTAIAREHGLAAGRAVGERIIAETGYPGHVGPPIAVHSGAVSCLPGQTSGRKRPPPKVDRRGGRA